MKIRTTLDNLLIGLTCYPVGAVVDVPEDVGKRLVLEAAASPVLDLEGPPPSEVLRPRRGRPPKSATSPAATLAERAVAESPDHAG